MYRQLEDYIASKISISTAEMETVLYCFHAIAPKKNEILVTNGQTSQRMFFVAKGCLRIFFINEEGQEATRHLAFEDTFATTLVSFITDEPSLEFIQAMEDTQLLYISRKDFYDLIDSIPEWSTFYNKYLEYAYVTNTNRLMSFIIMDALERYRQLLEQKPDIVKRMPNKMVASYLNISQETLSRLKSKV